MDQIIAPDLFQTRLPITVEVDVPTAWLQEPEAEEATPRLASPPPRMTGRWPQRGAETLFTSPSGPQGWHDGLGGIGWGGAGAADGDALARHHATATGPDGSGGGAAATAVAWARRQRALRPSGTNNGADAEGEPGSRPDTARPVQKPTPS